MILKNTFIAKGVKKPMKLPQSTNYNKYPINHLILPKLETKIGKVLSLKRPLLN